MQMVQNGDHKCSKRSEFPVEEEKQITEVRKLILSSLLIYNTFSFDLDVPSQIL